MARALVLLFLLLLFGIVGRMDADTEEALALEFAPAVLATLSGD